MLESIEGKEEADAAVASRKLGHTVVACRWRVYGVATEWMIIRLDLLLYTGCPPIPPALCYIPHISGGEHPPNFTVLEKTLCGACWRGMGGTPRLHL